MATKILSFEEYNTQLSAGVEKVNYKTDEADVEIDEAMSPEVIAMISTVLGIPTLALAGAKLESALEKAAKGGNEFAQKVLDTLRSAGKAASSSIKSESMVIEGISPEVMAMVATVLGIPTLAIAGAKLDSALEKAAKGGNEFAQKVLDTLRSAGKAASSSIKSESADLQEEVEEAEVEPKEVNKAVSEMLKETYEQVVKEACTYESDDYPEHTVEAYLAENSALCGALAAEAMEMACEQVRETELTKEMYEAACNQMKESFAKRLDEMMEAWSSK
jgi:hypothetical protein